MRKLTLGSLFDGSGGFPLGGLLCGITPLWASEVEPFPIRVTTRRFPAMKHYGDINQINGSLIPPVDIITAGFCCQDLSVAGKRAGLQGERSGLFYQIPRIIKEMFTATDNTFPKYAILENVPGMYSSAGGADFQEVLNELIKIKDETLSVPMPEKGKWSTSGLIVGDGFSIGWRTLDAQFWGVAQRRRRCYIVVDFTGGRAESILFDESRLCGNPPQSVFAGQGTAAHAEGCAGTTGCIGFEPGASSRLGGHVWDEHVGALRAHAGDNQTAVVIPINEQVGLRPHKEGDGTGLGIGADGDPAYTIQANHPHAVAVENYPADSRIKLNGDGVVQTLSERMGTGGGNVPLVMNERQLAMNIDTDIAGAIMSSDYKGPQCVFESKAYGICSDASNAMRSDNPHSGVYEADTSRTIDRGGGNPSCNQGGIAVVALQGSMIGREDRNGPQGSGVNEDVCFTLNTADKHAVAYSLDRAAYNQGQNAQYNISISEEQAQTLVARGPHAVAEPSAMYTVRRLTPQECALLQGFPSDWCGGLETPNLTEEDIAFWVEVWETHRRIVGKSSRPKSRNQIIKWLRSPYSDSAAYKMWGNGVALPCVLFVLSGIVSCTQE